MKNIIQRIDQKLSFVLSALIGRKKETVTNNELEELAVEGKYLDEQLEAHRELLDNDLENFNNELEEDNIQYSKDKIIMNVLIKNEVYDELEEEEFNQLLKDNLYSKEDIKIYKQHKREIISMLEELNCKGISNDNFLNELEDVLNG